MLDFAVTLAREAGDILMRSHGKIERNEIGYKGWRNLVTELDVAVEDHVAGRILERFPDHGILGEERVRKEPDGDCAYRWVIDPLDGTTNYVHSHAIFCVSICIEEAGEGIVGVVFAPYLEEMFTAEKGGGSFLNGTTCRVSEESDLRHALLASGFAYGKDDRVDANLIHWSHLSMVCRGLRRCGSAALDMAYVACGRYEGFWELFLSPWDVAAGAVLVSEAGGVVTDFGGGNGWQDGSQIIATNRLLHDEIKSHLSEG